MKDKRGYKTLDLFIKKIVQQGKLDETFLQITGKLVIY